MIRMDRYLSTQNLRKCPIIQVGESNVAGFNRNNILAGQYGGWLRRELRAEHVSLGL